MSTDKEVRSLDNQIASLLFDLKQKLQPTISYSIYTNVPEKVNEFTDNVHVRTYQVSDPSKPDHLRNLSIDDPKQRFYVLHSISPDTKIAKAIKESNTVYDWFEQKPELYPSIQHMYIAYKKDAAFDYNIQFIVRMLSVRQESPSIYKCSFADREMEHMIILPSDYSSSLCNKEVLSECITSVESSMEWNNRVTTFSTYIQDNCNTSTTLQENIMFYEAVLKCASWSYVKEYNKSRSDEISSGMVTPYTLPRFITERLFPRFEDYFKRYLQRYPDMVRHLHDLRTSSNQVYYFPHIYVFDSTLLKCMLRMEKVIEIQDEDQEQWTDLLRSDLFIKTNVLGRALTSALTSIKKQDMREFVINDFIRMYMRDTARKCVSFISHSTSKNTIASSLYAILEVDFFTDMSYLSIDETTQLRTLFTIDQLRELGPMLDDATLESWMGILYQYAWYIYDTTREYITVTVPEQDITEQDIITVLYGKKDSLQSKPTIQSTIFPSVDQLVGCVIESFMEYSILFTDLQGDLFLKRKQVVTDPSITKVNDDTKSESMASFFDRLIQSLTAFSDIIIPDTLSVEPTGIQWLTPELVCTCYIENDIPISISECGTFIVPMLKKLISIVQSNDHVQKQPVYKWIQLFTGRNNIMSPSIYQYEVPVPRSNDLAILLKEQKKLRQDQVDDIVLVTIQKIEGELGENSNEEMQIRTMLQASNPDHSEYRLVKEKHDALLKKRFQLLNRITLLELHLLNKERLLPLLPTWSPEDLSSLLSTEERSQPEREQIVRLHQLYHEKQQILTDREIQIIQARMVTYLTDMTTRRCATLADGDRYKCNEKDIHVILQSMFCYDLEHLFLFYSIFYHVVTTPCRDFILINQKQASFIVAVKEHIEWLKEIRLYPSVTITSIDYVISSLLSDGKPICHVVPNIIYFSPYSSIEHVSRLVSKKEEEFSTITFLQEWTSGGVSAPQLYLLVKQYQDYMDRVPTTLQIESIQSLYEKIDMMRKRTNVTSLQQYLGEIYYDLVQMAWFCNNTDVMLPRSRHSKELCTMISYYLYGTSHSIFTELVHHHYLSLPYQLTDDILHIKVQHILDNYDMYCSGRNDSKVVIQLLLDKILVRR